MNIEIILGIFLLLYVGYELLIAEAETLLIFEWFWFDVSRWHSPITYWFIIILQTLGGLFLIYMGMTAPGEVDLDSLG